MAAEPKKVGGPRKAIPLKEKLAQHVSKKLSPDILRRKADALRSEIDTRKLLKRLQGHAMGTKGHDMTPTQLAAAQALIRKTMPDLVGVKAEVESSPVVFNFHMGNPRPKPKESA